MSATAEKLFGVYLLMSQNPRYRGRVYIGFTVNPDRRKIQHNRGSKYGGARRTNSKGPWDMVLVVHGFPSEIAALRFEWAWQHPNRSRRLKDFVAKKKNENSFLYHLRIMGHMLTVGPWRRLPLTVQWLNPAYKIELLVEIPDHIKFAEGALDLNKKTITTESVYIDSCYFCTGELDGTNTLSCYNSQCKFSGHIKCTAKYFLDGGDEIIPIEKDCPLCLSNILWGKMITNKWQGL